MNYSAGTTAHPVLNGAPVGLGAALFLSVETTDNEEVQAPSNANIVESLPGSYVATRTVPTDPGSYLWTWYDETNDVSIVEEFEVKTFGLIEAGLRYTSPDELRTWLRLDDTELPDAAVIRPIKLAQYDIDNACGSWKTYPDTGLKFATDQVLTEILITDAQRELLSRATCAQVEYRLLMGDDFMMKDQYDSERGPDYSTDGKLRKVSGQVYSFLQQAELLHLWGRPTNRRRRFPYGGLGQAI